MRHFAGFGIIFTYLLIETLIISITKHELHIPKIKKDTFLHLMTPYS